MRAIEAILFEPVGCLAEFPADPFNEMAARLSGRRKSLSKWGSRSYWHLLNLMETCGAAEHSQFSETQAGAGRVLRAVATELEAVDGAVVYEDVLPALAELEAMGVRTLIASSLSNAA